MLIRLIPAVALLSLVWGIGPPGTRADEPARKPFLGIEAEPPGGGAGVTIRAVAPGSPADKAGLKAGDVIVKVGDQAVKDFDALVNALAKLKSGDKVALQVKHEDKESSVTVTLGPRSGPRPGAPARPRATAFLGVEIEPLTPETKERLGVTADNGAVIQEVAPGSPAAAAGLRRGDVITGFGDKAIATPQELREAIQQATVGKEVTLKVVRGKDKKEFKVKPDEAPADTFVPQPPFGDRGPLQRLERRIEQLEKRVKELEQKANPRPSS
jgi:S1-C subfamily serine protease